MLSSRPTGVAAPALWPWVAAWSIEIKEEETALPPRPVPSRLVNICCQQETHRSYKDIDSLKANIWKKVYRALTIVKKAEMVTLMLDKADFRAWSITSFEKR